MDPYEQIIDKLNTTEQSLHQSFLSEHANVTPTVRATFDKFTRQGRDAKAYARAAADRIGQLKADNTLFPLGRDQLVRQASDDARLAVQKANDNQRAFIEIMGKELQAIALPRVAAGREMPARDEVRMILDASKDPARTMAELARRGDELSAVVTGSFGESYLRARGNKDFAQDHSLVRLQGIHGALAGADPTAQRAAKAYFALDTLRSAAAVTRSLAHHPLEQVGVKP